MKNNQLQLVSFEQAKKLRELGFDYPTKFYFSELRSYSDNDINPYADLFGKLTDWNSVWENRVSTPEIALAFQWLRNEKGLWVNVGIDIEHWNKFYITMRIKDVIGYIDDNMSFDNYEKAQEWALDKALNLLEGKSE